MSFSFSGASAPQIDKRNDLAATALPPQDNGKDVVSLTFGLNLPVQRRRVRSEIAEAKERVTARRLQVQSVRDRLLYGVGAAILRLESIGKRARLHRDVIIPQARESLASAESAYTTNRLGFLDLLEAERILFQSRDTYQQLLARYWTGLADLELALGRRFPADDEIRTVTPMEVRHARQR